MAPDPSPDLQRAVKAFQDPIVSSTTTTASKDVVSDFEALNKSANEQHLDALTLLDPPSRSLVAHSYLRFGNAAKEMKRLTKTPWFICPINLLDTFGVRIALPDSCLRLLDRWRELQAHESDPMEWGTVRDGIKAARDRRQSGLDHRPGISASPDLEPSDIIDAAKTFNITLDQKRKSDQSMSSPSKRSRLEPPMPNDDAALVAPSHGAFGPSQRAISTTSRPASTTVDSAHPPPKDASNLLKTDPDHGLFGTPERSESSAPNTQLPSVPGTRSTGPSGAKAAAAPDNNRMTTPNALSKAEGTRAKRVESAVAKLMGDELLNNEVIWTVLDVLIPPWIDVIKLWKPLLTDITEKFWQTWADGPTLHLLLGGKEVLVPVYQQQEEHWALLHFDRAAKAATLYNARPSPACDSFMEHVARKLGLNWVQEWIINTDADDDDQIGRSDSSIVLISHCLFLAAKRPIPLTITFETWRRLLGSAIAQNAGLGAPPTHTTLPLAANIDVLSSMRDTTATLAMATHSLTPKLAADLACLDQATMYAAKLVDCLAASPDLNTAAATKTLENVQRNRARLRERIASAEETWQVLRTLWKLVDADLENVKAWIQSRWEIYG